MARGSFSAPSIHGVLTRMYGTRDGNTQRVGGENRVLEVEFGVLLVGDLHVTPVARLNLLW